jgi:hypothetical protein
MCPHFSNFHNWKCSYTNALQIKMIPARDPNVCLDRPLTLTFGAPQIGERSAANFGFGCSSKSSAQWAGTRGSPPKWGPHYSSSIGRLFGLGPEGTRCRGDLIVHQSRLYMGWYPREPAAAGTSIQTSKLLIKINNALRPPAKKQNGAPRVRGTPALARSHTSSSGGPSWVAPY